VGGLEKILVSQLLLQCNHWMAFTTNRAEMRSSVRNSNGARIASDALEIEGEGRETVKISLVLPFADNGKPLRIPLEDAVSALRGDEDAILKFGSSKLARGRRILAHSVLPHCATEAQKIACLQHGAQILRATRNGERGVDDRDDAGFKRLDCSGELCAQLLRMVLRTHLRSVRVQLRLAVQNKGSLCIDAGDLLAGRKKPAQSLLTPAFRTGIFGNKSKQDIVQPLNRFNYLAHISHLTRVSLTAAERSSSVEMRCVQPSLYGLLCASETPEGRRVGLTLQLASTCVVTEPTSAEAVETSLLQRRKRLAKARCKKKRGACQVFVEGVPVCTFPGGPEEVAASLRGLRKEGRKRGTAMLPTTVSIYHMDGAVFVWCCAGRLMRPVIAEGRRQLVCAKQQMQLGGQLEEVSSTAIFGFSASSIPFANHNQSPRVCFASAMLKQRIPCGRGLRPRAPVVHDFELHNGQRPLCTTRTTQDLLSLEPIGVNLVVAIACAGWNQEDSLVVNRAALDRGLLATTYTRAYTVTLKPISGESEGFGQLPENATRRKHGADYSLLDERGFARVGATVHPGCALVGIVARRVQQSGHGAQTEVCECRSLFSEGHGRVERVQLLGDRGVRVFVALCFTPQAGDKIMSRHGQKGTIGRVEDPENLPFTEKDGIIPDIVINPHGFPSRMTCGQLIESAAGKLGALQGRVLDCTPFDAPPDLEPLLDYGFSPTGEENFIMGTTGRSVRLTVGLCEYGALDKWARLKIHARTSGPIDCFGQPTQGKRTGGGQRMGEMERDNALAHGCSFWLRDAFSVDALDVYICRTCGAPCIQPGPRVIGRAHCDRAACQAAARGVVKRRIPRPLLILYYLLLCANIEMSMIGT